MTAGSVPWIFGLAYLAYALLVILLTFFLLRDHRMHTSYRISILIFTILACALLLLATITPNALETLLLHLRTSPVPIFLIISTLLLFIATTLLTGRIFCGYCCPIGAVQELAYLVPAPKTLIRSHPLLPLIRGALIVACLVLAFLASLSLFSPGFFLPEIPGDTAFTWGFTVLALISAAIIVLSLFLYRPFCRFACPYGALCSLAAGVSRFRMRKGPGCTACEQCEEACPTGEAGPRHRGRECYLCCRCVDACTARGTMSYRRR